MHAIIQSKADECGSLRDANCNISYFTIIQSRLVIDRCLRFSNVGFLFFYKNVEHFYLSLNKFPSSELSMIDCNALTYDQANQYIEKKENHKYVNLKDLIDAIMCNLSKAIYV